MRCLRLWRKRVERILIAEADSQNQDDDLRPILERIAKIPAEARKNPSRGPCKALRICSESEVVGVDSPLVLLCRLIDPTIGSYPL